MDLQSGRTDLARGLVFGAAALPTAPGCDSQQSVFRGHVGAGPEGASLAGGAKRAYLRARGTYVVSEGGPHHRVACDRPCEDRVGNGRRVDHVLRLVYELSDELYLALHRSQELYRQRMRGIQGLAARSDECLSGMTLGMAVRPPDIELPRRACSATRERLRPVRAQPWRCPLPRPLCTCAGAVFAMDATCVSTSDLEPAAAASANESPTRRCWRSAASTVCSVLLGRVR